MKGETRLKYVLFGVIGLFILWFFNRYRDSRPQIIYNTKKCTIELLEDNVVLNGVVYETQDSLNISNSLNVKKIGSNIYSIEINEIKGKEVILDFECVVKDDRQKFYSLFIDEKKWSENEIFVYDSPNH